MISVCKRLGKSEEKCTPLSSGLDHICGHQLQAVVQMLGEHFLWPAQLPDEGLQGVELPQEVFRSRTAVAGRKDRELPSWRRTQQKSEANSLGLQPSLFLEAAVNGLRNRGLHQIDVAHNLRREHLHKLHMELPVAQVRCGQELWCE